jgi:hypothetical protein
MSEAQANSIDELVAQGHTRVQAIKLFYKRNSLSKSQSFKLDNNVPSNVSPTVLIDSRNATEMKLNVFLFQEVPPENFVKATINTIATQSLSRTSSLLRKTSSMRIETVFYFNSLLLIF